MESIYATKPWLKHYDKHVPEKLEYPTMAYADVLRKAFQQVPSRVAVHYMGTEIPYRRLDELSNQFAHFLMATRMSSRRPRFPEWRRSASRTPSEPCRPTHQRED